MNLSFSSPFTFQSHIFIDGTQALQHEFRSLLNRHGHPVPPVVIVDLLSADEGRACMSCDKSVSFSDGLNL